MRAQMPHLFSFLAHYKASAILEISIAVLTYVYKSWSCKYVFNNMSCICDREPCHHDLDLERELKLYARSFIMQKGT